MIEFDLFKLHNIEIDKRPRSWICFDLNESSIKVLESIINKVLEVSGTSKRKLAIQIATKLDCSLDNIYRYIDFKKKWIAIPIIIELLKELSEKEQIRYKQKMINKIKYLKIASSTAESVKAVKRLSLNLCKIAGAHAADGTLQLKFIIFAKKTLIEKIKKEIEKEMNINSKIRFDKWKNYFSLSVSVDESKYRKISKILRDYDNGIKTKASYFFRIVEETKYPIVIFADLIKDQFSLEKMPIKFKDTNAWTLTCANKIFIRYLQIFLNFPLSKKSKIVDIPLIIKGLSMNYKKAFFKGFFQFDGSVELSRIISLQTSSENLRNSIIDFLNAKDINFSFTNLVNKKGQFTIKINKDDSIGLKNLFFKDTKKHQKLSRKFSYRPKDLDDATEILKSFVNTPNTSLPIDKLILIMQKSRQTTIFDLLNNLNDVNIERTSLHNQLVLLRDCNILKIDRNGKRNVYTFNENLMTWKLPTIEGCS